MARKLLASILGGFVVGMWAEHERRKTEELLAALAELTGSTLSTLAGRPVDAVPTLEELALLERLEADEYYPTLAELRSVVSAVTARHAEPAA